ncbi:MAG TPA: NADH-quinone oxidoreductase subunit N [Candidatus Thermoplasmatota archaeon]|nr:NADH-quinone oxidoreductase subunit N [Candidatus Thermoplasmatota archaeon]
MDAADPVLDPQAPTPEPTVPLPSASRRSGTSTGTAISWLVVLAIAGYLAGVYLVGWPNPLDWISSIPFEWQAATPEFVVLLFALLAPLVGLWDTDRRGMQQFALIGLGGGFLLTLGSLLDFTRDLPGTDVDFTLEYIGSNIGGIYAVTYASQLLKLLFLGVGVLAVIGIGRPLAGKTEQDYGEFYSLLLFATLGMMIVASSQELFTLFLGIEMTSMSSYLLAAFRRDRVGSEAALKYFVIGAISSGMTLFAISLLYGMAGTTVIADMGAAITAGGDYDAVSLLAIVLLLAGLGFKVSAVPFHAWAPDVYSGAPVPVAGVLASASKAMGFIAIFQVFLVGLVGVKSNWELAVGLLAVVTMTVGNLVALQQTNLRRMLAYSSIAQAGYILIAVAVGTWFAVGGGIFHLLTNAAMKLGAFLVVGALLYAGIPDHIEGWRGLGKRAPLLAFAMTVFLLSMAGLPPFGGFASKFVLFSGAIDAGVTSGLGWLAWLAVAAVLNSALSLYYYLRVIRAMYVDDPQAGAEGATVERIDVPVGTTVAVVACLVLVLAMGLMPQPFVEASMKAAQALLLPQP